MPWFVEWCVVGLEKVQDGLGVLLGVRDAMGKFGMGIVVPAHHVYVWQEAQWAAVGWEVGSWWLYVEQLCELLLCGCDELVGDGELQPGLVFCRDCQW